MKVIYKSGFLLCAGCLVSTIGLSQVAGFTGTSGNIQFSAFQSADLTAENGGAEAEAVLKNEQVQIALIQLRKNVNLTTTDLLVSSSDY